MSLSPSSIHFDSQTRVFLLRLERSLYALRVSDDGRVLHAGSGALPPQSGEEILSSLVEYGEPNYVWEQQATRFELPTFGDVSYHDVALKVAFPQLAAPLGEHESENLPVRDLRLRYQSHEIRTDAKPALAPQHGRAPRKSQPRETLCVRLKDLSYDFFVTLFYRLTPEHDIIERWIEVENGCAFEVEVESLSFGTVHLPQGEYEVTRTAGTWVREFVPLRQNLEQGRLVLDQQGLNTGHSFNPFFLMNHRGAASETAGEVHFGALAYSGNWSLRFEALPTRAVRVLGGYESSDFALALAPGEKHLTPAFIHGTSGEGWGGASRKLHGFALDYVLPGFADDEFRPVLYNSWEATYFDLSFEGQSELARVAASVGVELFCVDDGWFGARRSDNAGLGDWTVSPDVFPDGLGPLIAEVKRLGMKFGLWVEPEMVNPDSDLYRAHPDWVLHFPGRPRTQVRQQLLLDFGRPEVVEFIFNSLNSLLEEYEIDFFKWDMNRYATEPGSAVGKSIWRRHVEAVYGIMDRLRAAHPQLSIQSCSGGGGRIDLGILGRTDQVWTSDNTDAHDRVTIQDGFSLAYPPRAMESWVTHDKNHQTGRLSSLDLRFDVAMRGALGIGTVLSALPEEELVAYRRKIAFYKKIRPIVQGGQLHRLVAEDGISIWQTVSPDGSQAVYSAVVTGQLQGIFRAPTRLRGLVPEAIYALCDEKEEEVARLSGFQLMALGVPGEDAGGGLGRVVRSRTLHLQRVS